MKVAAGTAMLGILVLTGACAFGDRYTTLVYPPAHANVAIGTAAPASEASARPRVVLVPFVDRRMDKQRIAFLHNLDGWKTAEVYAVNSVPDWVMKGFQTELASYGFDVSVSENPQGVEEDNVVTGTILHVNCGPPVDLDGRGIVEIAIRAASRGSVVLERTYLGRGRTGPESTGSAKGFGECVSQALQNAAQTFAADLSRGIPRR